METLDISNTGTDVREQSKENYSTNEEVIKTVQIGKTPFVWVPDEVEEDNGSKVGFIAIGQYKLAEQVTMRQAEMMTGGEDWEFMIAVIGAITDQIVRTYTKGELKNEQ